MTEPVRVSKRPAWVSSLLAVAVVAYAVTEIAHESIVDVGVGVVVAGLVVLAVAVSGYRRGHRVLGTLVAVLGVGAVGAGVAVTAATLARPPAFIDVLPGLLGVALVGVALAPLRGHGSRWTLRLGVGLVFVGVLTSAVVQETTTAQQLLAGTLCIVAWDLGENAIAVGRQLGRRARTYSVELAHGFGTVAVAFLAIRVGEIAAGVQGPGASLPTFVVLVGAVIVLTAALHN